MKRSYWTGYLAMAIIVLLALLPISLLILRSLAREWFWPALLPGALDLRAWQYLFTPAAGIISALSTSLWLAFIVTICSLLAGLPAARALALWQFPGKRALFFFLMLPILAPPLSAAMGIHSLFLRSGWTDSLLGVALVQLIPIVPYVTLMLTSSFANFDRDYEAQARTLGATRWQCWRTITLPAIAPGLAVAASFAFLISWSQYLLTILIGGGRVITLPVILVSFQRGGDEAIAAALSVTLLLPALLVFIVVARSFKN